MPLPQIRLSIFQTKRNNELGLCGKNPSTKISTNKGSAIDPIDTILLKLTIHDNLLNSYCTQFSTVRNMSRKEPIQLWVMVNEAVEIIKNNETTKI